MSNHPFFRILFFVLGLLIFASCSTTYRNTDLLEYGYKGAVKSVKSTMYYDLTQMNGEWKMDKTKIESVKTLTFDKNGNIVKVVTAFPAFPKDLETTIYQFEDGRKTGFYVIDADKDTLETAVYNWKSETEYELKRIFSESRRIKSTSKLNANLRDLSGGITYIQGDSILHANSYINTINDNNFITEILFTNELTKATNIFKMTYSDFDPKGNALQLVMTDKETGELDNVSIREFEYFD